MALRYDYPKDAYLSVFSENLNKLPVLREPATVAYNGPGDIDDFLQHVSEQPVCKVVGPTGVGKSSVLPKVLALNSGKRVFVVTGHPLLAFSGYDFYRTHKHHGVDGSGLKACLMLDNDVKVEEFDIIWVCASRFVSWMVSKKREGNLQTLLQGSIVFLDEAHESDAYTHVVRTVTPHCGLDTLLLVSATFEPQGHSVEHTNVTVKKYPIVDKPMDWDVKSVGKPWSHNNIKNATLIFIDYDYDANRLKGQYADLCYEPYRLTAKSTIEEYKHVMSRITNARAAPVVILADSSFRSGFNFDVDTIIDTGTRYIMNGETGVTACYKRNLYNVEFVQSAGRGGRFGRSTIYYMPDYDPDWRICDLEPVEREAAALLTRCLGYFPNRETAATVMAYDDLPEGVDIKLALNGATPLSCYVRDKFGVRRSGTREVRVEQPKPKPLSSTKADSVAGRSALSVRQRPRNTTVETVVTGLSTNYKPPKPMQVKPAVSVTSKSTVSTRLTVDSLKLLDESHGDMPMMRGERNIRVQDDDCTALVSAYKPNSIVRSKPVDIHQSATRPSTVLASRSNVKPYTRPPHSSISPTELSYLRVKPKSIVPGDSVSQLQQNVLRPSTEVTLIPRDNATVRFEDKPKPILRTDNSRINACNDVFGVKQDDSKSVDKVWEQLLKTVTSVDVEPVKIGCYMFCAEVDTANLIPYSRYFPRAELSVLQLVNDGKLLTMAANLDASHIKYALYHALRKYNTLNMEINAVKRAMSRCLLGRVKFDSSVTAKSMFDNVVRTVANWEIERDLYFSAILNLASDNYAIMVMAGVDNVETKLANQYYAMFDSQFKTCNGTRSSPITDWIIKDRECTSVVMKSDQLQTVTDNKAIQPIQDGPIKVVYVRPMLGVSTLTVNPDKSIDVKPRRILRAMTGVERVGIKDVEYVSKYGPDKHKKRSKR